MSVTRLETLMSDDLDETPSVAVLLATFNGMRWLPEQVESILSQHGVTVRIIARDDMSTDGSDEWLRELADSRPNVTLLPSSTREGSAAGNFYRLILDADLADHEFISLSDQDDIWHLDKLSRHVDLLTRGGHDGVSSDVTAFHADGRRYLVRKSQRQVELDHLFESAGPGSTYVMTRRLIDEIRAVLTRPGLDPLVLTHPHDWLIYALARARGWTWLIDDAPSLDYRQHDDNVLGANSGWAPARERLRLIKNHWHREHVLSLIRLTQSIAGDDDARQLGELHALLEDRSVRARLQLVRQRAKMRRRPRDQRILATLIAAGIW